MKTIIRRLRRLEDQFCPPMETESSRRLRARLEAGLRRVAEARERGELSSPIYDDEEKEDLSRLSVGEILDRGRARVARAKAKREAAASASGPASRGDAATVSESPTKRMPTSRQPNGIVAVRLCDAGRERSSLEARQQPHCVLAFDRKAIIGRKLDVRQLIDRRACLHKRIVAAEQNLLGWRHLQ